MEQEAGEAALSEMEQEVGEAVPDEARSLHRTLVAEAVDEETCHCPSVGEEEEDEESSAYPDHLE